MLFEIGGAEGVEFAVEIPVQLGLSLVTRHGGPPFTQAEKGNCATARAPGPELTLRCQSGPRGFRPFPCRSSPPARPPPGFPRPTPQPIPNPARTFPARPRP